MSDRQGAAIEGASAILTDTATNRSQSTTTNEAGRYIFLNVAPGVYNISLSKEGFAQAKLTAQTVAVGLVRTLDVTLEVGSTSTSIDVKASAGAELQTTNATVGTTISGDALSRCRISAVTRMRSSSCSPA